MGRFLWKCFIQLIWFYDWTLNLLKFIENQFSVLECSRGASRNAPYDLIWNRTWCMCLLGPGIWPSVSWLRLMKCIQFQQPWYDNCIEMILKLYNHWNQDCLKTSPTNEIWKCLKVFEKSKIYSSPNKEILQQDHDNVKKF